MTEVYNSKSCVLWEKTKDLAKDHGFTMSNYCPMVPVCTGAECIFLDPITKLSQAEVINTEKKLSSLREELKEYGEGKKD